MDAETMLHEWPERSDHPRWNAAKALALYHTLIDDISPKGWMAALYGSTMRNGRGVDLDMICWPWRIPDADFSVINSALHRLGFSLIDARTVNSEIKMWGFCDEEGYLIDVQHRRTVYTKRWNPDQANVSEPEPI